MDWVSPAFQPGHILGHGHPGPSLHLQGTGLKRLEAVLDHLAGSGRPEGSCPQGLCVFTSHAVAVARGTCVFSPTEHSWNQPLGDKTSSGPVIS